MEKDDRSDVEENSTDEEPLSNDLANGSSAGSNNHSKLQNDDQKMK